MGIAKRDEGSKVNSNINVTPMVDVMLVLLIIFMVVTPMLQKGASVDMAKTENPSPMPDADKEDAVMVAVTRDGRVYLGSDMVPADQLTSLVKEGASPISMLLPVVAMLIFAYLILILPQQRRQKKWQAMLDAIKTGDKVITSGGLRGTVIALKDDAIHLRVPPDNLRIEVSKGSIVSLAAEDTEKK